MHSRLMASTRWLFLAAVGLAVMVPALAFAQPKPPPCTIDGPEKAACQATLCGPVGAYEYLWRFGKDIVGTTQCITVTVSGTYTLTVTDRVAGTKSQCTRKIFIEPCKNRPPDCTRARASDDMIWPPNHEMVAVEIVGVTDPDGDPILIEVYAITQDEPVNTEGDGNTCPDAEIVDGNASVRRERTGDPNIPGNGRVYEISFVAVDGHGGKCGGTIKVCVPHDMGQGDSCIDDGQIYDSLGSCP